MATIEITKENFDQEVLNSDKPVMLDFWATWCGPCRMVGPVMEEIADENTEIKVGKVNVDEQIELATAFNVDSIPMIAVIKDGKMTNKTVGAQSKESLLSLL